jgi:hypothetical protein
MAGRRLFALAALFLRAARDRGRSRFCQRRTIRRRSPTAARARLRPYVAVHEIEAALNASDADLAQSFVDLADDRRRGFAAGTQQRVESGGRATPTPPAPPPAALPAG